MNSADIWENVARTTMDLQKFATVLTGNRAEISLAAALLAVRLAKQAETHHPGRVKVTREIFLEQVGKIWDAGLSDITDEELKTLVGE